MSACERAIEVEDFVLGRTVDHGLEVHLETCADCMVVKRMFEEERALFAARPPCATPPLELPAPRRSLQRVSAALVGLAAAVTLLVYQHPSSVTSECEAPPPALASSTDEANLCEAPSAAPAMSLASHEPRLPACVESSLSICDEPVWLTSSSAMP